MRLSSPAALVIAGLMLPASVAPVHAQFPLSFVAGITSSTVSGDDVPDEVESKSGFFAAVGTSIPLSANVMIEPNVGFVQKGFSVEGSGDNSMDYIEIPIFLSVMVPLSESLGLGLSAGPQFSFQMKCETSAGLDCEEDNEITDPETTDFGVIGSAGLGFNLSETSAFFVGAAYDLGLKDAFADFSGKNRTLFLFAGFGILLGGGAM